MEALVALDCSFVIGYSFVIGDDLRKKNAIFGLKLWHLVAIAVAAAVFLLIVLLYIRFCFLRRLLLPATNENGTVPLKIYLQSATPAVSKRINERFYAVGDDAKIDVDKGEEGISRQRQGR